MAERGGELPPRAPAGHRRAVAHHGEGVAAPAAGSAEDAEHRYADHAGIQHHPPSGPARRVPVEGAGAADDLEGPRRGPSRS
ncbi:hypothetical protein, partial [Streptomyces albireticuli]|uniref:hypothetical protein n=1 Tax=Streptomyces albireticuli TaxID=1940 RepID=UPI001F1A417C